MSRTHPLIHIRLDPEVKDFLRLRAKQQERTMGAHITFLLRQEMEKEKASELGLENRSDASGELKGQNT